MEAPEMPLANFRHVLIQCDGAAAPASRRQKMQQELEGLIDHLSSPLAEGAKDCIDTLHNSNTLLAASASGSGEPAVSDIN